MIGWVGDIEEKTKNNQYFREVIFTGQHSQVTVMSIRVGEDVGLEVHPNVDQFLRIETGKAKVLMGPAKDQLIQEQEAAENWAIIVPAGTWHNVINTGDSDLKLYSIYSPANHPEGTIHKTKADAEAAEKAE